MTLLESSIPWQCGPFTFPAGRFYVEAAQAASAMMQSPQVKVQTMVDAGDWWNPDHDHNGRTILLVRSGGIGDTLFVTPLIREIKHRWPHCKLLVATPEFNREVLKGNPWIDGFADYPLPEETLFHNLQSAIRNPQWGRVLWFEGLMEWDARAQTTHAVDLHAEFAGLELTQGKHLDYVVDGEALKSMAARFPRKRTFPRRVAIQLNASAVCRTYPPLLLAKVIGGLLKEQCAVFLMGAPETLPLANPLPVMDGLVHCASLSMPLTLSESAALMTLCDAVLAPDSALCHLAGALGRPTVALYGPFPSALRTAYAPTVQVLEGGAECSPCFWHNRGSAFPAGMPCSKSGRCEVLAAIPPEDVVAALLGVMGESPEKPEVRGQ